MARNYLEDEWITCPLLRCCSKWLRKMEVSTNSFDEDNDLEKYESFRSHAMGASAAHGFVCLRGFIAIERMLERLGVAVLAREAKIGPKLTERTWACLTYVKRELEKIEESSSIEFAEARLGGLRVTSGVIIAPGMDVFEQRHMLNVANVHVIAKTVGHAISTFRPYLRNPEVQIDSVVDDLANVETTMVGGFAFDVLLETATAMLEVRL